MGCLDVKRGRGIARSVEEAPVGDAAAPRGNRVVDASPLQSVTVSENERYQPERNAAKKERKTASTQSKKRSKDEKEPEGVARYIEGGGVETVWLVHVLRRIRETARKHSLAACGKPRGESAAGALEKPTVAHQDPSGLVVSGAGDGVLEKPLGPAGSRDESASRRHRRRGVRFMGPARKNPNCTDAICCDRTDLTTVATIPRQDLRRADLSQLKPRPSRWTTVRRQHRGRRHQSRQRRWLQQIPWSLWQHFEPQPAFATSVFRALGYFARTS